MWASTSAVISMRNDSRSPSFQVLKISAISRGRLQAQAQQIVGLGDQLHVGVFDAVVHHLHEVAGTVRAHVHHARLARDLGRDRGEHRGQARPGVSGPAGHDRGTVQGALSTAGHPAANEVEAAPRTAGSSP
jgi:hypothetical protein